ncbi:MAG: ArdC family protein, partial [Candidatus Dormibacteria bacterium]
MTTAQAAPSTLAHRPRAELLDELSRGVLALADSRAWGDWLRASRRFPRYSFSNQVLILRQRPDATWVTGYRAWAKLGRQVRRGERGIRILAPCLAAVEEGGEGQPEPPPRLLGFRVARVFDVAQTEGPDLPQPVRVIDSGPADRELGRLGVRAVELG